MKQYVPLHLHTNNSLLDSTIKIPELISYCKENNMPACAISDHGVMYGAIEFYKETKKQGVKPIIGVEFYLCNDHKQKIKDKLYHLVLLAKNNVGYKNLIKLCSISHVDGFYYKPRIDRVLLEEYKEGLVCLSACLGGELAWHAHNGDKEEAFQIAKYYKELFGQDYYIELQDHGLDEQKRSNPMLIDIAKQLDIELVITNDSHYLKKEDAGTQDVLLCINTGSKINEEGRFKFPNNEFYLKNISELQEAFKWLPKDTFNKAIENTFTVAEKCNVDIDLNTSIFPEFIIPKEYNSDDEYLRHLTYEGLKRRYNKITKTLEDRIEYELGVIKKMGFSPYFLVVQDFIKYAKNNGIRVGCGRGSGAGSLVVYVLGITDIDPIEHNLLFERFLNPDRVSLPDLDIDFCIERRGEVIEYVRNKYGENKVCNIITFGTFAARASMKAVARALDIPYMDSDKYAKMIPSAPKTKIDDALEDGMELKKLYDSNPAVKELVDFAKSIEGLKYNIGTHAAGVIISRESLDNVVPIQRSKEGDIITQYPMADAEAVGLIKMDFLGLKNLTIIDKCLKLIKQNKDVDVDINKIPLDDKEVYGMLSKGNTDGVFQLESNGMKALVKDLKPSNFEDISALVALFRPGALNSGATKQFVDRKNGREKIEYVDIRLKPVLEQTYGSIIYQEQVMQVARILGGYTMPEADEFRKIIGKKKAELLPLHRRKFINGAINNNIPEEVANAIFDGMAEFANYAFNKCLSGDFIPDGQTKTIEQLYNEGQLNIPLDSYNMNKQEIVPSISRDIFPTGEREVFEVEFSNGQKISCTIDHKFLCYDNRYYTVKQIIDEDLEILEV